ncbi:MAG: 30S ribosomal protein S6 [Verrucomicrobiota bacterium]
MKHYYEATYILNIDGKEEGVEEMADSLKKAIESLDGSVHKTQKMGHRKFERVAGKLSAGYYLGLGFELDSSKKNKLEEMFTLNDKVYRQFYISSKKAPQEAAAK